MELVKCVDCKNMILENECKFIGSPYVGETYTNFRCFKCGGMEETKGIKVSIENNDEDKLEDNNDDRLFINIGTCENDKCMLSKGRKVFKIGAYYFCNDCAYAMARCVARNGI